MNLRTPRRRISPRTIKRYRAIKNFLQRALGSSSQPNINTNSSFVSISNLKQKIVGIKKQLNSVSRHCQDLACLDYNLRPTSISTVTTKVQDNVGSDKGTYVKGLEVPETKMLYKTSLDRPQKPVCDDDTELKTRSESKMTNENNAFYEEKRRNKHDRLESIQEGRQTLHKHHSAIGNYHTAGSTTSYNSFYDRKVVNPDVEHLETRHHKKRNKKAYEMNPHLVEERWRPHKNKNLRNKDIRSELGQDFIADIIRRQYRPVKLFGRRESDFSQFSAPVCRDQEFSIGETVQKGSKLCSCCHEEHRRQKHLEKYMCSNDLSDMRSICDTRLYSCRKQKHQMNRRKRFEDYNDSAIYDIVPVKEKSSPKSRRKFEEDNVLASDKYREVPPSPRTQRPRLNLQARLYTEEDNDYFHLEKLPRNTSQPKSPIQNYGNHSNISSKLFIQNRNGKGIQQSHIANTAKLYSQERLESISSVQHPRIANELANNDTSLNSQTTDTSVEKTDKTLIEIKDILQSFLMEMKKESSQNDNLNITSDTEKNVETQRLDNRNTASNFGCRYNNSNTLGQCVPPFLQSFTSPCCYPILPMCPMNCMQNGFVVSNPSCTCAGCANNSRNRTCGINDSKNKTNCSEITSTETQKLIKEIHKLISQNPNAEQKKGFCNVKSSTASKNYAGPKILMSRSVGGSSKASKHDAQVETKMKCYSKSCEVIGFRHNRNTGCAADVSYSDTVLEKGSSEEASNALSTSEYSSDTTIANKKKENRFLKMLKSIGFLKKNKTNAVEKLCESDSSIENQRPQARPPFQQHLMSYNMLGQEYYNPPPLPPHQHQLHYCNHSPSPRACYSPHCAQDRMQNFQKKYNPECCIRSHCASPQHTPMPDCPNYYDRYSNVSPQVPLCLKEIEVKSIGTQSVRKMSLLQKFTNKMQTPAPKVKESAQTQFSKVASKNKAVRNTSDWKKWQTKPDPLKFCYKTQKRLAEGDIKMRNAMLKKLLYKRNPFTPRNLLVRTLLGKDMSSFGEPPKIYKPKMFL